MWLKNKIFSRRLTGLDIGTSSLKAVEISSELPPRFLAFKRVELPKGTIDSDGKIIEREALRVSLKKLFAGETFSSSDVVLGLNNFSAQTRKMTIPEKANAIQDPKVVQMALSLTSLPLGDLLIDCEKLWSHKTKTGGESLRDILLVVAPKKRVSALKKSINEVGLQSSVIDYQCLAVGNSFFFNYTIQANEPDRSHLVVDCGAGSTKVIVVERGKTVFTSEIPMGGNDCSQMIQTELSISFEAAEALKKNKKSEGKEKSAVHEFSNYLAGKIFELVNHPLHSQGRSPLGSVLITGGTSQLQGLKEILEAQFRLPVNELNPLKQLVGTGENMKLSLIREASVYAAVALGLALRSPGDKTKAEKRIVLK